MLRYFPLRTFPRSLLVDGNYGRSTTDLLFCLLHCLDPKSSTLICTGQLTSQLVVSKTTLSSTATITKVTKLDHRFFALCWFVASCTPASPLALLLPDCLSKTIFGAKTWTNALLLWNKPLFIEYFKLNCLPQQTKCC